MTELQTRMVELYDAINGPVVLDDNGEVDWNATYIIWHKRWNAIQKAIELSYTQSAE